MNLAREIEQATCDLKRARQSQGAMSRIIRRCTVEQNRRRPLIHKGRKP